MRNLLLLSLMTFTSLCLAQKQKLERFDEFTTYQVKFRKSVMMLTVRLEFSDGDRGPDGEDELVSEEEGKRGGCNLQFKKVAGHLAETRKRKVASEDEIKPSLVFEKGLATCVATAAVNLK